MDIFMDFIIWVSGYDKPFNMSMKIKEMLLMIEEKNQEYYDNSIDNMNNPLIMEIMNEIEREIEMGF